ncbi:MAG: putative diheme cytochrome c-553 [Myxococcaceae bacterium]|nr:putative diheme cytochrome c-553 [Myxococcaceae bacterium]
MTQAENKLVRFGAPRAHSFWKAAFASAALIGALGCGDDGAGSDTPETPKDALTGTKDASTSTKDASTGTKDASTAAGSDAGTGSVAAGLALTKTNICTSCHQADYAGLGFYPNITPDPDTGIGDWTDQQIKDAVTKGVDDEGKDLCALMQRYKFTATQQNDLVAFLRSLPAVNKDITDECPAK